MNNVVICMGDLQKELYSVHVDESALLPFLKEYILFILEIQITTSMKAIWGK